MNRFALTLAATLVLSSATGIHAFHHFGCGACGHCIGGCGFGLWNLGGCGFHGCGYSGCGYGGCGYGGCGFGHRSCGYAGCGLGYGGCGLSYGACGQGCGPAISYGSAPLYGGYVSMQPIPALWTVRSPNDLQPKSPKIGASGQTLNTRARTIVVDLRSFDLDAPSTQMRVATTKSRSGMVVQGESVK